MPQIKFLKHQKLAIESVMPEVILSGAYGSGKSRALCAKLVFLSLRYPGNRGYLCRKTLQSLKGTTLKTLLEGDGDLAPVLPSKYIKSHNKTDREIVLVNGSLITYGPMDKELVKSMNLGWVAADELSEFTEEEWNALNNRLRLNTPPVRQAFAATNPSSPKHWIYNRAVENPVKNSLGQIKIDFFQSSTLDNHYLPEDYIENLKRTLFGHYYQRYVLGLWVGSDKLVYDNFDPRIHIIKNFVAPKQWKRFRSVDFGFTSPFSCQWYFIAGEGAENYGLEKNDVVLYKEIYYTRRTTSVNADRINEFSYYDEPDADGNKVKEKFLWTVADWDSGDRADLESKGIKTVKADKDVSSGIQKVREYLGNTDPDMGLVVRPTFYIFGNTLLEHDPKLRINLETGQKNNNPIRTADEFMTYSWEIDKNNNTKETPEDEFNHGMDANRYALKFLSSNKIWKEIEFKRL